MPVKIKNKITGEIKIIKIGEIKKYPSNIWDNIAQKDITWVYERLNEQSRMTIGNFEKNEVEEVLIKNPNCVFEYLQDFGKWNNVAITENDKEILANQLDFLPIEIPNVSPITTQTTPSTIIRSAGTWVVKIFNKVNNGIVLTIIAIIGTVVGGLILAALINLAHGKGFTL